MKIYKVVIAGVIVLLVVAACSSKHKYSLKSKIGKPCVVQFKRNALGAAAAIPVPVSTDNMNGADVSIHGTLVGLNKGAIVISNNGKDYWIPRDSILYVQTESAEQSK